MIINVGLKSDLVNNHQYKRCQLKLDLINANNIAYVEFLSDMIHDNNIEIVIVEQKMNSLSQ